MKRVRQEAGYVVAVDVISLGDSLTADAAIGATTIYVDDAVDFDPDGGVLDIDGVQYAYGPPNDDTGALPITTSGGLSVAADDGDRVSVWDDLQENVATEIRCMVDLSGDDPAEDNIPAVLAQHLSESLPEGGRGLKGEAVVLEFDDDGDEWRVVDVLGNSDPDNHGRRWEDDDAYALTAADVTAGSVTMQLSHRPIKESLVAVLGTAQRPTGWSIDYDAQTLTMPLSGWEEAGDVLWVHYAYRKGVKTPVDVPDPALAGFRAWQATPTTAFTLPAGTTVGDLMLVAGAGFTDTRLTEVGPSLWVGIATDLSPLVGSTNDAAIATFHDGRVLETQVVPLPQGQDITPNATFGAAKSVGVMAWSGFFTVVGNISPPGGYANVGGSPSNDHWYARAAWWLSDTPTASPTGTIGRAGSIGPGHALFVRMK